MRKVLLGVLSSFLFTGLLTGLFTGLFTGLVTSVAFADASPAPTPTAEDVAAVRKGFYLSLGVGGGSITFEDANGAADLDGGGLHVSLGGWLTPRVVLAGDASFIGSTSNGATLGVSFTGVTITGYVHPRFYLLGGVGAVRLSLSDGTQTAQGDTHGALMLGLGVAVYRSGTFELNIETRAYGASASDGSVSAGTLGVGFQWD